MTLLFTVPGFCSDKKVGTSAAEFLKIGAGARPTAMGEAFTGIADDVNAVHYNPAGLSRLERPEITAMHTQYFQDMNYEFGAFAYPTERGTLAFSASTLKIEDFDKRGVDESFQGNFDSVDAAYALSYARNFNDRLSLGLTGRYVKQEIDTASAGTWAGDIGLLHRLERLPLSMGLAVKNFGQKVKFIEESDSLPLTVNAGVGSHWFNDRLTVGFDLKSPRDNSLQFGAGAEYRQTLGQDFRFALRGGYNSTGTDADGTTGISFGGGVGFKQFGIDFAWVPFGDLGNTMRYSVLFRF